MTTSDVDVTHEQLAVVFPGQGSQRPQMARPWKDVPSFSRWQEASEILGWDVARLGIDAHAEELRLPSVCQIALFVHHTVIWETWRARVDDPVTVFAGHSLGEYNAITAAGAISFEEAVRLVAVRGDATQHATVSNPGTMIAALGVDPDRVVTACAATSAYIANDNAPGQVTISGTEEQLCAVETFLADERGKTRRIEVGAAYHSPLMAAAVAPLRAALGTAEFTDRHTAVIANVDATVHNRGRDWSGLLQDQVVNAVRWRETVETMRDMGVTTVTEIGATAVLGPMIKRVDRTIQRRHIAVPEDL